MGSNKNDGRNVVMSYDYRSFCSDAERLMHLFKMIQSGNRDQEDAERVWRQIHENFLYEATGSSTSENIVIPVDLMGIYPKVERSCDARATD